MVDRWIGGRKFVVSARASRKDPLAARLLARIYYRLVDRLVVSGYPRGGYDLMLMDKAMLPHMLGSSKNTNLAMYAFWLGFEPVVLRYERRERGHGRSRYTLRKRLHFLVDTISGFSVKPIRILSLFGIVVALLSFLYGADIVIMALLGNFDIRSFATPAALITFFSGLILFMLGVLGEYLWRAFDAVNDMPKAVIDETFL
jgi:dolichol-phosphate mannosyltransferase